MKNVKEILLFFFIFIMICGMACSGNNAPQTDQSGKEYTSTYICPMHCEGSGSAETGECPVCGMDYVKNKDAKY